eukprot:Hpha_TRINITY_DN21743_c0_g1::TRINITY_DN21743_c0_g1_i1::g.194178::m.194178
MAQANGRSGLQELMMAIKTQLHETAAMRDDEIRRSGDTNRLQQELKLHLNRLAQRQKRQATASATLPSTTPLDVHRQPPPNTAPTTHPQVLQMGGPMGPGRAELAFGTATPIVHMSQLSPPRTAPRTEPTIISPWSPHRIVSQPDPPAPPRQQNPLSSA